MKKLFAISIIAAAMCSCATIVHSGKQNITFESSPANAVVLDNGVQIGQTPLVAKLERNKAHQITIQLNGFKPYEITLERKVDWGWAIVGNIFSWDIIGIIVDYATGALYKLTPDMVNANFGGVASLPKDGSLLIAVTLSPDPSWQKIGQLEQL